MATKATLGLALLFLNPLAIAAHDPLQIKRAHNEHAIYARQSSSSSSSSAPAKSSSSSVSASSSVASASGTIPNTAPPSTLTATNPAIPPLVSIVSGMPSQATPSFSPTFTPGAQPPVSGAPPLPTTTLDRNKYPSPTQVAPVDSPQVSEWLKELDGVQIPDIPPTTNGALCSSNAEAAADKTRCWWTCGGCTRDTDVSTCPTKLDWGVSFDDGPSPYTESVLSFLDQQRLHATFYVVGTSAYWLPQIVQAEYMAGHQIAVHTWFHPRLTTLTNEQIVAELGWTREIIKDIIGVTPNTMRPPYGDIDDRVRAISLAMGLQPMIWTRDPTTLAQYDTNDWEIPGGVVTGQQAFTQFQSILQNATDLNTGFIVLEHDLYQQTVELATGYTIPAALSHNPPFKLKSISECLNKDPKEVYQETATNKTLMTLQTNWTGNFLDGLEGAKGASSDNSTGSGSGSSSGGGTGSNQGNGAGRMELGAGAALGVVLAALAALLP